MSPKINNHSGAPSNLDIEHMSPIIGTSKLFLLWAVLTSAFGLKRFIIEIT